MELIFFMSSDGTYIHFLNESFCFAEIYSLFPETEFFILDPNTAQFSGITSRQVIKLLDQKQ